MRLFIAEKPSVAQAIIAELGSSERKDGYVVTRTNDLVSWCFGHLLEMAEPEAYLKSESKFWNEGDLPIFPEKWLNIVKKDCKKQLVILGQLLKKCDKVVNCGDPDREGQLLVDEVLEYFKNKKPVDRYWISAQDSESVRTGLKNLQSNSKFKGLCLAAKGRQRADWLIGMNLTRAYTLAAKRAGNSVLLSVGRVQTPTLNLVATRDQEIKNFKPISFFIIKGNFNDKSPFNATLKLNENFQGLDTEKKLIDLKVAKSILEKLKACKTAIVTAYENKNKNVDQPLAMSLADLQQYASSKWGFSAQKTLNILQSLYEKHKLTSYPRTDCKYIPESQHKEAAKVMSSLKSICPKLEQLIDNADLKIKSKTFNDKKITAHHGLVPTAHKCDLKALNEDEFKVWDIIVKRYIAQFYPPAVIASVSISLDVSGFKFTATGSTVIKPGFKYVLGTQDEEFDEKVKENVQKLPVLVPNSTIDCIEFNLTQEKTKAPPAFTEGSLIRAMENIHSVVEDPTLKKYLKDGDGIGTSATRAAIIDELKRKGFLEVSGKKLKATDLGQKLLSALPDIVKNPVLTALFESKLKDVESGNMSLEDFEKEQKIFVSQQVTKAKSMNIRISDSFIQPKKITKKLNLQKNNEDI